MYPPDPQRLLIQKPLFTHLQKITSFGLKVQLGVLSQREKTHFVTHLLERTCSLSSIFHPDYLIREIHPVLQERRLSLQSDSLDCSLYVVALHYRSLVKLRPESQIPPPLWRGPSRREHSPRHPTDTPLHIQLPQKIIDLYELVYISHPARGDSNSGEHSQQILKVSIFRSCT